MNLWMFTLLREHFRRRLDITTEKGNKKHNNDGGGGSAGKCVLKIVNIDFKLNLRRCNFSDSPPAVPARHFLLDDREDVPPPVPERNCSLDTSVNEDFQARFHFHPLSLLPLPQEFSSCLKQYPSQTPTEDAFQCPPSQPTPPPIDYFPSTVDKMEFQSSLSDVSALSKPNTSPDSQSPVLCQATGSGLNILPKNSQSKDTSSAHSQPPPSPKRKVPPPRPTTNVNLQTSTPVAPTLQPSSEVSSNQSRSHQLTNLRIKTQATSDPDFKTNLNKLKPSLPLSPQPLSVQTVIKPKLSSFLQSKTPSNPIPSNSPSASLSPPLPVQVVKYKQPPLLPIKKSQKKSISLKTKNLQSSLPRTLINLSKNNAKPLSSRPPLSSPEQLLPTVVPPLQPAPSLSTRPQSGMVVSVCHQYKQRPLPPIPVSPLVKTIMPPRDNGGCGGVRVVTPTEEGDMYDVMESTDM